MRQTKTKKVFVGLSGGVDSSVSAALLKNAGYDVTGVFIRVWNPASKQGLTLNREEGQSLFGLCEAADDRLDAMRICAKLAIPFVELDLEKEYKKEVVDYMIRDYSVGKTPNPDVMCNRYIKFGGFYKWAMRKGADFVATGHYARVLPSARSPLSFPRRRESRLDSRLRGNDSLVLCTGTDSNKDQSYFLWQIKKEQLPHILFPVGGMEKPEVRKLAKKFGLITADKKDSQGLCFIGKVDMKEFLQHYIMPKKGKVLNEAGKTIGEHDGAFFYTLGQRMAINLSPSLEGEIERGCENTPLYVTSKDIEKNTLIVSQKSPKGILAGSVTEIKIKNCNWLVKPRKGKTYQARTRYRQPLQSCHVLSSPPFQGGDRGVVVVFDKPQTVAPGQSLVLYDGDMLIGGGIIA
ncbi:MAG: tRNA-specific 2-thiouridylase MnmA [Parcubacteria group bacterium GW2011_GWA2_49_9]|nr:MAG: tRNA-specific 2-thiouridylase MnmA [Parcubacteria group bacterium GW2011_GWA2_49_9]